MEFIKYCSIENSYRDQFIKRFALYNDFTKIKFVMLEKIHGSNFQIVVEPTGLVEYGSKNHILEPDEKFYEWQETVKKTNLYPVIHFAVNHNVTVKLFAEIHGDGIQKGVYYQKEKMLRFFDIKVNDIYQDYNTFDNFMKMFDLPVVPVVAKDVTLEEALAFDVDNLISLIAEDAPDDNIAEGVVIRPMYEEIFYGDSRFILKLKSKKHAEKQGRERVKKEKVADPVVDMWNERVLDYVTENRMMNLFSKKGVIQEPKQIGDYIKDYMADMMEDFLKDFPEFRDEELTKNQKKQIMAVTGDIVGYLHKHL